MTQPFDFDTIILTSVGRGEKIVVDTLKNDIGQPLLGDWYGVVRISDEPYVLTPYYLKVKGEQVLRWQLTHKDDIGALPVPQKVIDEELTKFEGM